MPGPSSRPAPPSDDRRWRIVEGTMRRQGYAPDALIETLHTVQDAFGFLEPAALRFVATSLRLPPSRVYGVATFYHYFSLKPAGQHTCVICTGTACYIKNSSELLAAVAGAYQLAAGETTADGQLSLLTARCFGACSLAPVAVVDGQLLGLLTPGAVLDQLRSLLSHDA